MSSHRHILTLSCPNRSGIVAAVSGALFELGCNIAESHQFDDVITGRFFMRVVYTFEGEVLGLGVVRARLAPVAAQFAMDLALKDEAVLPRVVLMVSRFDHCLADLLYRWRIGELPMRIAAVISNYPPEIYDHLDLRGVPFRYLPVTKETKAQQEAQVLALVEEAGADLVVLARYMQVLSDDLSRKLAGRCINIHHSFLPGFKGAKPYHQAHARGVKVIGATAHYVTADLDEGPIIEQDVERVSHADSPEDLVRKGRDIERRVLARAVSFHLQGRVLLNGATTVVFRD